MEKGKIGLIEEILGNEMGEGIGNMGGMTFLQILKNEILEEFHAF